MTLGIVTGVLVVLIAFAARGTQRAFATHVAAGRMTDSTSSEFVMPKCKFPVSQKKYEKQLPVVLDSVSRSLFSGSSLLQALREASRLSNPAATDLQLVVHQVDLGVTLEDALLDWSERVTYQSVRVTVSSVVLAINAGGNQAAAIDSASSAVRRTINAADAARTHSTDARISTWALAGAPLAIAVLLLVFNAKARHFSLTTPLGLICLVIGLVLDGLSLFWLHTLTKRVLS